jgi:hypothetical protein
MSGVWQGLFVAAATIITGVLSWLASRHAQRNQAIHHVDDHELNRARRVDEATATLLDGYKDMVEDLRTEVSRLNDVIDALRLEQEECERRNDEMESLVLDLQRRLVALEGSQGG